MNALLRKLTPPRKRADGVTALASWLHNQFNTPKLIRAARLVSEPGAVPMSLGGSMIPFSNKLFEAVGKLLIVLFWTMILGCLITYGPDSLRTLLEVLGLF